MNANCYQVEEDHDYQVLEDPPQSKGLNYRNKKPALAGNYEGSREDSVSMQSYEVPVNRSQQKWRKECQDFLINETE